MTTPPTPTITCAICSSQAPTDDPMWIAYEPISSDGVCSKCAVMLAGALLVLPHYATIRDLIDRAAIKRQIHDDLLRANASRLGTVVCPTFSAASMPAPAPKSVVPIPPEETH